MRYWRCEKKLPIALFAVRFGFLSFVKKGTRSLMSILLLQPEEEAGKGTAVERD